MKKGFTLIELLVSIAILGLIMLIAVPRIGDVINESKNNAYLETVSTIENAAQLYRIRNSHEFSDVVGEKRVVTIKQLQDAGFLKSNIKDPRYGTTITDGDVFVVLQSNGEYSYTHTNASYVKDNLVLWYDALWHGTNQNTWLDRSGNNRNGTLTGFNHDASSGWKTNSLLFDGSNDYVSASNPLTGKNATIIFLIKQTSPTVWTNVFTINTGVDGTATRVEKTDTNDYRWYGSLGGFTSGTAIFNHTGMQWDHIALTFDGTTARSYKNGTFVVSTAISGDFPAATFINIGKRLVTQNWNGEIREFMIYSKALSDAEIKQNYLTDKERFNF